MKGEEFFDPPGIHQRAERSINELLDELKSLHAQSERLGRDFLASRIKEGDILIRIKQRVGHNHWQKWGETHLPYDLSNARRRMRDARQYHESKTGTVPVLDDALKAQLQDAEVVEETGCSNATIPRIIAWPENSRCRDCRVMGFNDPNCKACQALNKAKPPPSRPNNRSVPDPTFAENLPAREEFGPGADDGDLDEAAKALAAVLAKKIQRGIDVAAFKHCKAAAVSLGLEVVTQGGDPKFNHPVIQQAYRDMTKAKWGLCRALKQEVAK